MKKLQLFNIIYKKKQPKILKGFLVSLIIIIEDSYQKQLSTRTLNVCIKQTKKSLIIKWNETLVEAFNQCKLYLENASLLTHPVNYTTIAVSVEASNFAMGPVLGQKEVDNNVKDIWKPLAYYSKPLSETQKQYSTYDRELLVMYSAIKYFRHWIEG
ncbi:unnamed protein product [Macrosiphum euphorbiae]|uniref:Reverse transcriptase/retrotransposon-derived protein RNase H-like domain-containing protein n=1 Tax=Macrosiphum euphorbiae TaxID=13131 RepID=A0AAV0WU11_9HEMI|nr:unnamed protein product [Macrosiphum euphorbiae]